MGKQAIFPGSFDPFTVGHEAVVQGALTLFDKVIIGIGVNSQKSYLFSVEERKTFIRDVFKNQSDRIQIIDYKGLTVNYCKENGIGFIIRGLRNTRDFQMEYEIANMNRAMDHSIETIFLASLPEHAAINSTIVREIYRNGGDVSHFLPKGVKLVR